MLVFLLVFLTLYGGLNLYIYLTITSGLGHHSWLVAVILALLVLSPLLVRLLEKKRYALGSTLVAWLSYNWMGIAFLFASIALLFDLAQCFLPGLSQAEALYGIVGVTLAASVYGFWESRRVGVRYVSLRSPKLPNHVEGQPLRIVQISDLHLGYGTLHGHIKGVLEKIQSLEPNLLVSTGDLFDSNLDHLAPYVDLLAAVKPPRGKIAITGNHEVYAGLEQAEALTRESGFRLLKSASEEVAANVYVAGVDDPEALNGKSTETAEAEALEGIPEGAFVILLKHRPDITASTVDDFDLQLSGHTHGGQIFPFVLLTRLQYKAKLGLSRVAAQTHLYLSRGTGTWGPQIRVFAPPEITVFDLSHGDELKAAMVDGRPEPIA